MNQNIWGPHFWFMLHSISFNYPLYPTIRIKDIIKHLLTHYNMFYHVVNVGKILEEI